MFSQSVTLSLSLSLPSLSLTHSLTHLVCFCEQDGDQNRVTSEDELDMDVLPPGVNFSTSWTLHQVALSYDTGNKAIFPGASNREWKTDYATMMEMIEMLF